MRAFTATNADYRILQSALRKLHHDGIYSSNIHKQLEHFYASNIRSEIKSDDEIPHYSATDRVKDIKEKGEKINRYRNENFACLIWAYMQIKWPTYIEEPSSIEIQDPFYVEMLKYYDASDEKSLKRLSTWVGRYIIYHFSQKFQRPRRGVVIGELTIDVDKSGRLFSAVEFQSYDGNDFGAEPMTEDNTGYCFYKHGSIAIFLRKENLEKTPKWYLFDHPHMEDRKKTGGMTGHMCQLVRGQDLFTSAVYAKKVDAHFDIKHNILQFEKLPVDIMDKLLYCPLEDFYELRERR